MSVIEEDILEVIKKIKLPDLKNKRILITGASGLVGVYLSQFFKSLKQEFNIEIYCWIKNKVDPNFNNIFDGLNIIQSDITDLNSFEKIPYFDIIFHCSGYGQPVKFLEDEIKTIEINTLSTNFLLKKLNKFGKFLFVSTSEIYSGIDVENITEEMIGTTNTDHFRSCYIEGKRCGESICHSYIKQGYDVKIARLCLAYGPGTKKDDGRVLNSIVQKSIINNKITLLDNGEAIRTYCYISDVIEMFINILFFGKKNVYNVGGKSIVSIFELANLVANKTNTYVELPNNSNPLIGNPKVVNISIEKYQNEFNKSDFLDLSNGIDKTIKWQKKYMNKITYTDFEEILGFNISEKIKQKIENYNLIFRDLDEKELNDYYNKNLEVLTSDITYSGSHRKNDWESGWGENLNNFITTKNNEDLIPKYHGKNKIVKWRQKPILPLIENFDLKIHICFIDSIIEHYSNGIKSIYEFGCGPGYHLLRFSESYPNTKLYGGDWAESSQKTIIEINKNFKSSITPFNFNFFSPDMDMDIDGDSLFYTVAALEQVGSNFRRYIDYIMEKKPKICINIEPISELLDENNFFDNLSIKYFKKRNYLNGYLDFLIDYEKRGFIEILDKRRIYSGSYFIEGHSLIVWRPL